jgi:ABC-type Fe3+ transport system permease subunit
VIGGLLSIAGFFLIPVVGFIIGFVVGVYLSERQRLGSHPEAWPSTRKALSAAGLSILIELASGLLIAGTWLVAVLFA